MSTLSVFVIKVWPDEALDYDFTFESVSKTFLQPICMYEPGRDKGMKIAQDLLWPRTKHLIEDHSMSFTSVLELAIGGEPTKTRIRFSNGTER